MDLTTIVQRVLQYLAAEKIVLSEDLTVAEEQMRAAVLLIGAKALEEHLSGKKLGYEGSSRPCDSPACRRKHLNQKFVNHRTRTVQTLMGQLTFKRAYYHCKHCGRSCCPYDQNVGLGRGQLSVGLAKAATLVAAMDPFIPAAKVLHELTGQRVGDRTVHRVTRQAGKLASEAERRRALAMAAWSVPAGQVEARPKRLYVAVDGVMVHREQWNEAKCVCCYWEEEGEGGRVIRHSRYAVRFESAEQFKAYVWSLAMRCGLESATEVILLGDGAAWIWEHVAGVLGEKGPVVKCITDWYHVMEHLWACGNTLHGQGTAEATAWVKARETLLWEGRYTQLIAGLNEERKRTRSLPRHRALAELSGYLGNQGARLAYDRFRACGYDIGSGRVESACKHVVQMRMKRSGMIWSDEGAQDVLSLRVAYLNQAWQRLWAEKPLLHENAA
jgi:hypothetical protein